MATFAERMKYERQRLNLSQEELAYKVKLGRTSISKYETGKQIPEMPTLENLANFFNVSIDYLLGKTNSRNYDKDEKEERTIALHSDYNYDELPPEARKEIENFIEFIKIKYKDK